jgi:phage tail-like protein
VDRAGIELLLPTMFQLAARPGSPLDALLQVMADLHEPDERILEDVDAIVDPYRTPAPFVPWLTRWVGLDWLVTDDEGRAAGFEPGTARLRDCIAVGHEVATWRGTEAALLRMLTAATGVRGFAVEEPPERPFHLVVTVPAGPQVDRALLLRIVAALKPAASTAELVVGEAGHPVDATSRPAPLDVDERAPEDR